MLSWCVSARRLRSVLPSAWDVSLVALTLTASDLRLDAETNPSMQHPGCASEAYYAVPNEDDCPTISYERPSAHLLAAMRSHLQRRIAAARNEGARKWLREMGATLAKWHCLSMTSYDAILFSDVVRPAARQAR